MRLTGWLLRLAAFRWRTRVQEERLAEWLAEVDALRHEPAAGGVAGRELAALRFAVSLVLTAPPREGRVAVRWWASPTAAGAVALLGVGGFFASMTSVLGIGPFLPSGILRPLAGMALRVTGLPEGAANWVAAGPYVVVLLALVALGVLGGAGLGRGLPGVPAPVVVLAVALSGVAWSAVLLDSAGEGGSAIIGILVWAALCTVPAAMVRRLAVAGRLGTALIAAGAGLLLVVELASVAAAATFVPPTVEGAGLALIWAPQAVAGVGSGGALDLAGDAFGLPGQLLLLTALAFGYGLGAAPRGATASHPAAPPAWVATPVPDLRTVPDRWWGPRAAALAGLVVALASWAHTVATLTPAVPDVAQVAPMPGGDGELYMWVAELRWGAILLAALALLVAVADRHRGPHAVLAFGGMLLGADAVVARAGVADPRLPLATAAAIVGVAWLLAGPRSYDRGADVLRRRLIVVAVTAAGSGPLLLLQGTPAVNHPFLPLGFAAVTAILPALFLAVALVATWHGRVGASHAAAVAAVAGLAIPPLVALGTATDRGLEPDVTGIGLLIVGPVVLTVVGLLRQRRLRMITTPLWALLGLAASLPIMLTAISVSVVGAPLLFLVAGSSYPADGVAAIPGAAVTFAGAGVLCAQWLVTGGLSNDGGPSRDLDRGSAHTATAASAHATGWGRPTTF